MPLHIGNTVPNFKQNSTFGTLDLYALASNQWVVLFSHPADFTPVCTTELGTIAKLKAEFDRRNTKVIALSVDDVESHLKWVKDINETQQVIINYPIIADRDRSVSNLYGMINTESLVGDTATVRSVFIIDSQKKLRLTVTYPASTGRNFYEILRVVDSLQLTDDYRVATPANWQNGDDCLVLPSIPTEQARAIFPKGIRELKPYLRLTPQPNHQAI
jgi:alkyl hydroperoxide reductase subunit AhpC